MNALPEHRRAIHARTHTQMYRHSDYAGFEHTPRREARWERIAGVLLAVSIGFALAASLVAWWSA